MFLKRSEDPEILDDFSIQDERVDYALKELKIINFLLGGNGVSSEGIKIFYNRAGALNILDIGCGASDILIQIKKKLQVLKIAVNYISVKITFRMMKSEFLKNLRPEG